MKEQVETDIFSNEFSNENKIKYEKYLKNTQKIINKSNVTLRMIDSQTETYLNDHRLYALMLRQKRYSCAMIKIVKHYYYYYRYYDCYCHCENL